MGRSKLEKFKIIAERDNIIEPGKELFEKLGGKWKSEFFKNDHAVKSENH